MPKVPPADTDCSITMCVDFLGGAWTPQILWYLRGGPRRFGDLRRDLSRVSAKVLTKHLRVLEQRRLVTRRAIPSTPPTTEYSLTPFGERFAPILDAIAEVGREIMRSRDGTTDDASGQSIGARNG